MRVKRFCKESLNQRVDAKKLPKEKKRAIIERAAKEIFDFPDWEGLLEAYGLAAAGSGRRKTKAGRKHVRPNRKEWHTGPESDAHKGLKRRIASDPRMVGLKTGETGGEEQWLWSGDEVDVYFGGVAVAVEVKAGNAARGELHRGVFQCIKYKAVLEAQQISEGEVPTGDCRLAIGGRLPDDLRGLCERLGLRYFDGLDNE